MSGPMPGAETLSPAKASTDPGARKSQEGAAPLEALDYQELSRMEFRADAARHLYWKGDYTNAARLFSELCATKHPSTPLYLNERACCRLALGQYREAIEDLGSAAMFLENMTNSALEKKALALYGREASKVHFGDPYERAMDYLLLALAFMDRGDYDNALAACKSGILADSDAMENRYQSDFTLLYLLEAKCHMMRGEPLAAEPVLRAAAEAFCSSHPSVRDLTAARADCVAGRKLSKKERREQGLPETDEAIEARIVELDEKISARARDIDVKKELGLLHTCDFNTLIIVPQGRAPGKTRKGSEAQIVVFEPSPPDRQPATVAVDGQPIVGEPIDNTADLVFQATTRGGRQMDAILKGKASFKNTTVTAGRVVTEAGNAAGGVVGLGMALLGAAVQGMGGAVSPEADTRCWETLPAELHVYALKLADGPHEVTCSRYVYFEKVSLLARRFELSPSKKLAVAIAPPSMSSRYSAQALRPTTAKAPSNRSAELSVAAQAKVVVPPPLGLALIERFPSPDQKTMPRAFAPDPKRMGALIVQAMAAKQHHAILLDHDDIVQAPHNAVVANALAFQVEFMRVDMKINGKEEAYTAEFSFGLVKTTTGEAILQQRLSGKHVRKAKDKGGCTDAFYACFQQAITAFLDNTDVIAALQQNLGNL
jgi:tetratricopeptide (TPR) repeat protein